MNTVLLWTFKWMLRLVTSLFATVSDQFPRDPLPTRLRAQELQFGDDWQVITDCRPELIKQETEPLDHWGAHLLIRAALLLVSLYQTRKRQKRGGSKRSSCCKWQGDIPRITFQSHALKCKAKELRNITTWAASRIFLLFSSLLSKNTWPGTPFDTRQSQIWGGTSVSPGPHPRHIDQRVRERHDLYKKMTVTGTTLFRVFG